MTTPCQRVKKHDPVPNLRPAGKIFATPSGGISADLQMQDRPPTPDKVKPFRKSFFARVGCAGRHWGSRNDPTPPDVRFGIQGAYEVSLEECLRSSAGNGLNALAAERAEHNYLSHKREPLGRSALPTYTLPDKYHKESFAFGKSSKFSENAKTVIYNGAASEGESRSKSDPGAQKDRNYNWAGNGIDPTKHRFGCTTTGDVVTTKELFSLPSKTSIIPLIVAQHQCVQPGATLGITRNMGFGTRPQTKAFVYGKQGKLDSLGGLLRGEGVTYPEDETLGRPACKSATLRRLRQHLAAVDPNRTFGCPSVRVDLPKPKYRKVASGQNYGDDASAGALLYGGNSAVCDDFLKPLTFDELNSLLERSKYGLSAENVKKVFDACSKSADGRVTLDAFRTAVDELGL